MAKEQRASWLRERLDPNDVTSCIYSVLKLKGPQHLRNCTPHGPLRHMISGQMQ
jgi:hypothetical protein